MTGCLSITNWKACCKKRSGSNLRRSRHMHRGRRKTMKTSVRISSVGNRNACGSTDRLGRKMTTLCICKTLEMNTCHSIPASYVVLNHTYCIHKMHFSYTKCLIIEGMVLLCLATCFGNPRCCHHVSKCLKLS